MKSATRIGLLLAVSVIAAPLAAQPAPETVASLHASLRLLNADGQPIERAEDRQLTRLSLDFSDAQTGRPPDDLMLSAWVRAADAANPSCEASVRSFRATRSLGLGTIDLNGILLVTLNRDATMGVIDPKLNLRSSNMLAAHRLSAPPAGIATDPARMRLLAAFSDEGELRALSLHSAEQTVVLKGLHRPSAVAMAGADGFWLAQQGAGTVSRHDGNGGLLETLVLTVPSAPISFRPVAIDPSAATTRNPAPARLGAFAADGALLLVEASTGRVVMRQAAGRAIADAAFMSNGAILTLSPDKASATLRFADRPETAQDIPIGIAADHISAAPDGRFAIAYARGGSMFVVIDIASAQVVQSFQLEVGTVSDVLMTARAGFVLSHDGGFVAVMDTAALGPGREALLRRVPLAGTSARPEGDGPFLVSLAPAPTVLAVDPSTQTGWLLPETAATSEIPPMDSVRLRGGVPTAVVAVDRAFRRLGPGRYEASWAFDAGPQELVLTTAGTGLSRCIPFTVNGDLRRASQESVLLHVSVPDGGLRAGIPFELTLALRDEQGRDRTPAEMEVLLPSMISSWREVIVARRGEDGGLRVAVTFPHAGPYSVQPLHLPEGLALRSSPVLEVPQ